MKAFTTGPFTGRHFTAILVAFFAVVIAVNVLMARAASATFGGVVVDNSYVASQRFNSWLDEAAREKALGWTATARRIGESRIEVALNDAPENNLTLRAIARHPLGQAPDQTLQFARQSDGTFVSLVSIPAGRWRLRLDAESAGRRWRQEVDVQ